MLSVSINRKYFDCIFTRRSICNNIGTWIWWHNLIIIFK